MSPLLSPNLYTAEFHNWEFLCKRGCAHPFQNMYMTFSWILSNNLLKHGNQRCLTRPQLECVSALDFTGRCKHPSLEPLWRRQLRNDLLIFSKEFIIFHFLPLAKLLPMPLQIAYGLSHNKLPLFIRNYDPAIQFKILTISFLDLNELHLLSLKLPTIQKLEPSNLLATWDRKMKCISTGCWTQSLVQSKLKT